jgi:hypothetical protein
LIPDAIDLARSGLPADYWVPPYTLAYALAHKLGMPATPRTVVAGEYRVSAMGKVEASLRSMALHVDAQFGDPGAHHLLVAGVGDADGVILNGSVVPRAPRLEGEGAWSLDRERSLLEVRVPAGREAALIVKGLAPRPVRLLAAAVSRGR